jgi:hypothetical protein
MAATAHAPKPTLTRAPEICRVGWKRPVAYHLKHVDKIFRPYLWTRNRRSVICLEKFESFLIRMILSRLGLRDIDNLSLKD